MIGALLVVITPPDLGFADLPVLQALLAEAAGPVHLRLPHHDSDDLRRLLDRLTAVELAALTVHRHPDLLAAYPLAGIHLPWTTDLPLPAARCSLSAHRPGEVLASDPGLRYCFLSPVYPAISKPGYDPILDHPALRALLAATTRPPVLALGGITPARLSAVAALGFDGAALLGWLWQDRDAVALLGRYRRMVAAGQKAFDDR